MVKCINRAVMALLACLLPLSVLGADAASQLASFQPYTQFASGAGEGYANRYRERTKEEFVSILRDPGAAVGEMRVSCEVLVRQMTEAHPDLELPYEGCEGAAAHIESNPDYAVIDCSARYVLAVTNETGTEFGTWSRDCYQGEKILTYKGKAILSLTCLNPIMDSAVTRPAQLAARIERTATPPPQVALMDRTITRGATIDFSGSVPTTFAPHDYSCTSQEIRVRIYDALALQVPSVFRIGEVDVELPAAFFAAKYRIHLGEEDVPEDNVSPISKDYGLAFNNAYYSNVIGLYDEPVYTEVVIIRNGQASQPIYEGWVTGEAMFPAPEGLQPGDVINTRFPGNPDSERYNERFDVGVVSPGGSGIRDGDPLTACVRTHSAIGGNYVDHMEWLEDVRYRQFGQYADYFEGRR